MKTIVCTKIEGGLFVATSPNCPGKASGHASTESQAINYLIAGIRAYIASHESKNKAVPWVADAVVRDDDDQQVRMLSGVWPTKIKAMPKPKTADATERGERDNEGE